MKLPLRIAVLETGSPRPAVMEKYGGYGEMFIIIMRHAANSLDYPSYPKFGFNDLKITRWHVMDNENEYPNIADIDAVLITGSRSDPFNNESWTVKLVEYTKMVLEDRRVRAIGVCYGHQIIARALGVPVGRSTTGWEISVVGMDLTEIGKSVFGQDTLSIFQMHQDEVRGIPVGVQLLASTEKCENQGMYQKGRLITVQGHPEFTEGTVKQSMKNRKEILLPEEYEDGMRRLKDHDDGTLVIQAFLRFLLEEE